MEKFIRVSIFVLGFIPYLFIISLLTFYLYAANILGYYPIYNNPDSGELFISQYYRDFITFSLVSSFYAFFG